MVQKQRGLAQGPPKKQKPGPQSPGFEVTLNSAAGDQKNPFHWIGTTRSTKAEVRCSSSGRLTRAGT